MKTLRTASLGSNFTGLRAGKFHFPLKKIGEKYNKSKTIYPSNHEHFKNSKPMVQFYRYL